MRLIWSIQITPMPAPRQARSDAWNPRPCVIDYRKFKDAVREAWGNTLLPMPCFVLMVIPMPSSWSEKKRRQRNGTPHQNLQDKDKDNLEKALWDAIFSKRSEWYLDPIQDANGNVLKDDGMIWSGWTEKRWGYTGSISVYELPTSVVNTIHNAVLTDMGVDNCA